MSTVMREMSGEGNIFLKYFAVLEDDVSRGAVDTTGSTNSLGQGFEFRLGKYVSNGDGMGSREEAQLQQAWMRLQRDVSELLEAGAI